MRSTARTSRALKPSGDSVQIVSSFRSHSVASRSLTHISLYTSSHLGFRSFNSLFSFPYDILPLDLPHRPLFFLWMCVYDRVQKVDKLLSLQECQKRLDHKLSLDAYLLKPVQRITKYQLMLKASFFVCVTESSWMYSYFWILQVSLYSVTDSVVVRLWSIPYENRFHKKNVPKTKSQFVLPNFIKPLWRLMNVYRRSKTASDYLVWSVHLHVIQMISPALLVMQF